MKGSGIGIWSHIKRVTPLRAVALYAIIGGMWVLFSDRVLAFVVKNQSLYIQLSTAKGWLYVAVTAILFYFLFYGGLNDLQKSEEALQESYKELLLTHGELESTHQEMEATHEELVAAEQELKQQFQDYQEHEAYYGQIFEGISSGILIQNSLGKVIHVNDAACRMLKCNRALLNGTTPDDGSWHVKYSDGSPFIWEKIPEGMFWEESVSSKYREIMVCENNGTRSWISMHTDPILNHDSEHAQEMATTLVDITEEKYMQIYERLLKEIDQLVLQVRFYVSNL